MKPADVLELAGVTRAQLGRLVRERRIAWARRQPQPKPAWLVPFADLSPADQEADMAIGEALFQAGWDARGRAMTPRPCHCLCQVAHPHREGVCDALNALVERSFQLRTLALTVRLCWPCATAADEYRLALQHANGHQGGPG
jgi:hypothetical protein